MRRVFLAAVVGFGVAACGATAPVVETPPVPDTQPAPPPLNAAFLPANTHLQVELVSDLDAETARTGDVFTVRVVEPIIAQNSAVVVPDGSLVTGLVTGVAAGDQAAIRLNFVRMSVRGVTHPMSAAVVSTELSPAPDPEQTAEDAAAAAAAGAVLGAVITGALRDALVGAALGTGAGTIISLGTGDTDPVLPAGTQMTIRTRDRLDLRH
jgi:hypothetical protein